MSNSEYTAQRIEDTTAGWLVIENETGKKHVIFCNKERNTAEEAVSVLIESLSSSDSDE